VAWSTLGRTIGWLLPGKHWSFVVNLADVDGFLRR